MHIDWPALVNTVTGYANQIFNWYINDPLMIAFTLLGFVAIAILSALGVKKARNG